MDAGYARETGFDPTGRNPRGISASEKDAGEVVVHSRRPSQCAGMRPLVRHAFACLVLLGAGCGGRATSLVEGKDGGTGGLSAQTGDASAGGEAGPVRSAAERDAGDAWSVPTDAASTDAEPGDAPAMAHPCESPQDCAPMFGPQIYCCIDHVCIEGQAAESLSCDDPDAQVIQASNYDQSCTTDSDCVAVSEGSFCYPGGGGCPTAAIRASALAQYQADVSKTWAASSCFGLSGCPAFGSCCRAGMCQANQGCVSTPADTLPACADAGGSCSTFVTGCGGKGAGPPDSCAYPDEMCCIY
ncbi:MAG TPA: hypothetical protein VN894_12685 [Polyangiaceae bacterium]|nr:hypothetical protein [Polyangiaceae bacterium]